MGTTPTPGAWPGKKKKTPQPKFNLSAKNWGPSLQIYLQRIYDPIDVFFMGKRGATRKQRRPTLDIWGRLCKTLTALQGPKLSVNFMAGGAQWWKNAVVILEMQMMLRNAKIAITLLYADSTIYLLDRRSLQP